MAKTIKYFIITFGDDKKTIDNRNLTEVQEEEITRIGLEIMQRGGPALTDEQKIHIRNTVLSERKAEKIIIESLINQAAEGEKELAKFGELADLSARLRDTDEVIDIEASELEWLRKSFSEIKKRPPSWLMAGNLINQIISPKEKPVEAAAAAAIATGDVNKQRPAEPAK